jgi:protein gp37
MPTKIEWTDESWNPVVGCSKVSEGCLNCYAEKMAHRLACICVANGRNPQYLGVTNDDGKWNGKIECCDWLLEQPLHWRNPRRIFVCSMGDLFHPAVPFEFIDKVMAVIALCPQHTFQILTKHENEMVEYYEQKPKGNINIAIINGMEYFIGKEKKYAGKGLTKHFQNRNTIWPLPNLHLGVSVENPKHLDRIEKLVKIPAAKYIVSFEPLLSNIYSTMFYDVPAGTKVNFLTGNVYRHIGADEHGQAMFGNIPDYNDKTKKIDQIIIGCESGPKRRPCNIEWVRSLVRQGQSAGVAVFVKQIHLQCLARKSDTRVYGKQDNRYVYVVSHDMSEWPEDLRVREYPK